MSEKVAEKALDRPTDLSKEEFRARIHGGARRRRATKIGFGRPTTGKGRAKERKKKSEREKEEGRHKKRRHILMKKSRMGGGAAPADY